MTEVIHLVLEPPALLIYVDVPCSGNLQSEKLLHQEVPPVEDEISTNQ